MPSMSERLAVTSKYRQSNGICAKNAGKILEAKRLGSSTILAMKYTLGEWHSINYASYVDLVNGIVLNAVSTKRCLKKKTKNALTLLGCRGLLILLLICFPTEFSPLSNYCFYAVIQT